MSSAVLSPVCGSPQQPQDTGRIDVTMVQPEVAVASALPSPYRPSAPTLPSPGPLWLGWEEVGNP
jgi:hypothetical protein